MAHERAAKARVRKERNALIVLSRRMVQALALVALIAKGSKPGVALPRDALHAGLAERELRMLIPAHAQHAYLGRGKQPLDRRMMAGPCAPPVGEHKRQFVPCMLLAGKVERDDLLAQHLRSGLRRLHGALHGRRIDAVNAIAGRAPADGLRLTKPQRGQRIRFVTGIAVANKVQQHGTILSGSSFTRSSPGAAHC